MAGMFSSIGPTGPCTALAPRSTASFRALAASFTRNAMALAEGPWASRKAAAWPDGSMLRMKLMSPWRNRSTFFERCLETAVKPISLEQVLQPLRLGRGELDELEAVGAQRVFEKVAALRLHVDGHRGSLLSGVS